jgi:hypothetical protein
MAKIDKVLGSISPVYGMASGQGAFANLRKISPLMHAIGETDTKAEKRRKKAGREADEAFDQGMRKGGKVKKMAKGGSASKRADGCATKGKTKGRFV